MSSGRVAVRRARRCVEPRAELVGTKPVRLPALVCPLTFLIVTVHVPGTTTGTTRCGAGSAFVDKISQGHDLVSSPQGIGDWALGLRALGIRS